MGRPKKLAYTKLPSTAPLDTALYFRISFADKERFDRLFIRDKAESTLTEKFLHLLDISENFYSCTPSYEDATTSRADVSAIQSQQSEPTIDLAPTMDDGLEDNQDWDNYQLHHEHYGPGQSADGENSANTEKGFESWDDDADEGSDDDETPYFDFSAQVRRDATKLASPLLPKKYFLRFSESARNLKLNCAQDRTLAHAANAKRLIVERRSLVALFKCVKCSRTDCLEMIKPSSVKWKMIGFLAKVTAVCQGGHAFSWATSEIIHHETKEKSSFSALDVAVPAAVIISGNNELKMRKFAKVLNLQWASVTHFFRLQRGAVLPAITKCSNHSTSFIYANLKKLPPGTDIILMGDGQYDSPGSSAKICYYSLRVLGFDVPTLSNGQEFFKSGYIVSQAIVDRRHADNKSSTAEHIGLHVALRQLYDSQVPIAEVVTDEHSQVGADFKRVTAALDELLANRNRKDKTTTKIEIFMKAVNSPLAPCNADNVEPILRFYAPIKHSLDYWHKAKNVAKGVNRIATKFASGRLMLTPELSEKDVFRMYAKALSNHLWRVSQDCDGDVNLFRKWWLSAIDHCHGIHVNCHHTDDALSLPSKLPNLSVKMAAFRELVDYIFKVANSAEQLARFRHTGQLENYNSSALAYTPKRIDLDYDIAKMRRQLAIMDHNHNLDRSSLRRKKTGAPAYTNKFSRGGNCHAPVFLKEPKDYTYVGHLLAAVLYERATSQFDFTHDPAKLSKEHPSFIQKTISRKRQAPSRTLAKCRSRFARFRPSINNSDDDSDNATLFDSSDDEEEEETDSGSIIF